MKTIATVALCAVGAQAQWSWTSGGIPIPGSPGLVLNPLSQAVVPENSPQWHLEALRGQGLEVSVNGAITPKQTPEWEAAAARNAAAPVVKREAEAEPWYGWRGFSGAPIAGGALVIGQNSVTPDYTPEQKGAAWGLNWGLVKRDADSEADAFYGYGGYGYGGLGLGYGGYGGYGAYGYGKRSADADAYYGYGGYLGGYGGYGYGGYGLGYGKRSAEAEPWYGWRGFSGAPIAGGALVIGQNSVTPDYTPEQKGAAWGLNWGLVKRDADSEADAYYGYGGYGGYGLGGYAGYGGYGLGYAYGK